MKRLVRLVCVMALALVAACGGAEPAARDHLLIWHSYRGEEKAALEAVIARYNERLKAGERSVKAVAVPNDAFADKISAAVPRGKGPDLFIFAHDRLGGWVESGDTVAPLDFFLEAEDRARFLPGLLDATTYKGVVWALPLNFKSIALIYNKALVRTPPRTTAELETLAKATTDQARGRFAFAYPFDDYFFHAAIQNGFGGGVFGEDGALALNSPANIAAAALVADWKGVTRILPDDPTTSLITGLFNQNRVGMVFSGPWFLGEVAKGIEVGVAVLPTISEADGKPMRPWMSVEAVYIAAGADDPQEAWNFASFLTGPDSAAIMALDGGQFPAAEAVYRLPQVRDDPIVSAFKAQALTAVPTPNQPEMTLVWSPADKAMKRFTKGETAPDAAWNDAQAEVAAAIEALARSQAGGGEGG
jgi:arabinogalactan oligomer/maltooligosaccharide transport system substrate-binding protein